MGPGWLGWLMYRLLVWCGGVGVGVWVAAWDGARHRGFGNARLTFFFSFSFCCLAGRGGGAYAPTGS